MPPTTGDDFLDGTSGDDTIDALAGNDTVNGLQGTDSLDGNTGDDSLSGGDGTDTLIGGDGNDTLLPGSGFDQVFGGADDDRILIPAGLDFFNTLQYGDVDGGTDVDTLALPYSRNFVGLILADGPSPLGSSIGVIDLVPPLGTPGFDFSITNIEFIEFSDQTLQILLGDVGANSLSVTMGVAGFIYGGDGADTLAGGALFDSIIGGDGADSIVGGGGGDIFQGGRARTQSSAGPVLKLPASSHRK